MYKRQDFSEILNFERFTDLKDHFCSSLISVFNIINFNMTLYECVFTCRHTLHVSAEILPLIKNVRDNE